MICRRNALSDDDDSILIMDTGADQCTCGGSAWTVLEYTGEMVRCDGYIKDGSAGPTLPIVSAVTCVTPRENDEEPFLLVVHQAVYHSSLEQTESICPPYPAEVHGVKFDLTPKERMDANDSVGKQRIIIGNKNIPLHFDGRKTYLNIRNPTTEDINMLESFELTSPSKFTPEEYNDISPDVI